MNLNNQSDALRNFLSLFAVTRDTTSAPSSGGAATPDNAIKTKIKNGAAVYNALFGSGQHDNQQLIQNVFIGGTATSQNPFEGMNKVLGKLGFTGGTAYNPTLHHGPIPDHHNHYHIDLRPLVRKDIPLKLLADGAPISAISPVATSELIDRARGLLDEVQHDLNLTQGEVLMFIADLPSIPPENLPVLIAQANQARPRDTNK